MDWRLSKYRCANGGSSKGICGCDGPSQVSHDLIEAICFESKRGRSQQGTWANIPRGSGRILCPCPLPATYPLFIPPFLLPKSMPSRNGILSQSYAQAYGINRTIRAKQRRPATQPRSSGVLGTPDQAQATTSSLFAPQGVNGTNNVGPGGEFIFGQQNRTSQSFDQPTPSNPFGLSPSVSFPPFQGSTNTEFKPAFAVPPSSNFAFTPPPMNNPFSAPNQNSNQPSGFQGSIFSIPPSTPFGASSSNANGDMGVPKAVTQPSFSWGSSFGAPEAQQKPRSSVFDTISAGPKPKQQPVFAFEQSSSQPQQPPSNPFNQNNTSSLFGTKSIFGQTPSQANLQTQSPSATNPPATIAPEQQTVPNLFGQQTFPVFQPQSIEVSPRKDEDRMSTTPDSSPQAKGSATSRPFDFLNHSPEAPQKDSFISQGSPRDFFGRLAEPAFISKDPSVKRHKSSSADSRLDPLGLVPNMSQKPPDDVARLLQPSAPNGNATEPTSIARSDEPNGIPVFSLPSSETTGAITNGLFGRLNMPSTPPLLQSPANLAPPVSNELETHQNSHEAEIPVGATESSPLKVALSSPKHFQLESMFEDQMWGNTPVAPDDFTDSQREQLATAYQLRCVDVGLQQHILKNSSFHLESDMVTKFYLDLKRRIVNGEELATERLATKKRKASEDVINENYGKRTRLDTDLEPVRGDDQTINGGWLNAPNRPKALLTEPALLPQVTMSQPQGVENPFLDIIEKPSQGPKQVSSDDVVSYPSLSTNTGSLTSNLFKNILQNKQLDSTSGPDKRVLEGNKTTNQTTNFQENSYQTDVNIRNDLPSLFGKQAAPTSPLPAAQPAYPVSQQPTNANVSPAISSVIAPMASARSTLTPPKFGTAQPVNFLSQFGKAAEQNIQKEKASRKANDFDSDEDDEAEWERKDAEQQRAKKQKLEETVRNKSAKFVPGKGFTMSDQGTETGSAQGVNLLSAPNGIISTGSNKSVLSNKSQSLGNGHNIFGHLSDAESGAEGSKIGDADDEETGSDGVSDDNTHVEFTDKLASDESQHRGRTTGMDKRSEPISSVNPFGPPPTFTTNTSSTLPPNKSEQNPSIGRSIFDRISKDENGRALREVTPPRDKREETIPSASSSNLSSIFRQGSSGTGTNIFRQQNLDAGTNIFGQRSSEVKVNIFGKQTTDSNIFGQRDLGNKTSIAPQPTAVARADTVEQRSSEATDSFSEQLYSTAGARVTQKQLSETGVEVLEQPSSEVKGDAVSKRSSDAVANAGEERKPRAEAHVDEQGKLEGAADASGRPNAEAAVKSVEQVRPSISDNVEVVPAPNSGLFPSTPSTSIGTSTPLFTLTGSPGGDNTWKINSPIKFGSASSSAPGLTLTAPSPSKPSLGGLFGPSSIFSSSKTDLSPNAPEKPSSNIFNFSAGKAPTVGGFGFNFGGPPTAPIGTLAAPLGASNASSRATSPGITTGDNSAAESNAEGADDGTEKHEQLNLADKGPGEEDEDILFSVKAKAMIFESSEKGWVTRGVGKLRVLKHRDTAKTRVLMKQDPSGKIILNAALLSTMKYEHMHSKSVKLGVATDVGKLVTWLIRTGKDEDAIELARILEENKSH